MKADATAQTEVAFFDLVLAAVTDICTQHREKLEQQFELDLQNIKLEVRSTMDAEIAKAIELREATKIAEARSAAALTVARKRKK